jgi:hypothetical protein
MWRRCAACSSRRAVCGSRHRRCWAGGWGRAHGGAGCGSAWRASPHPVAFLLLLELLLSGRQAGHATPLLCCPRPCPAPACPLHLQGYNASIVAYGQTGTGKTFTMEGGERAGPARGIIPRAIEDVFEDIQRDGHGARGCKFLVRASYLQIYNEVGAGLGGVVLRWLLVLVRECFWVDWWVGGGRQTAAGGVGSPGCALCVLCCTVPCCLCSLHCSFPTHVSLSASSPPPACSLPPILPSSAPALALLLHLCRSSPTCSSQRPPTLL